MSHSDLRIQKFEAYSRRCMDPGRLIGMIR
jgi:hypothetical protein